MAQPDLLEGIDFSDPLTQALFDRTPEQRARHGQLVVACAGSPTAEADANKQMFREFLSDLDRQVQERLKLTVSAAVTQGPSVDENTLRALAAFEVRQKIAFLHETLPVPMIDRLGISHD